MDFSTLKSERITAIVSTLIAVAILAAGVAAYQSRTRGTDDIVQLESDLRFQLEVGFRHDTGERSKRLKQLNRVISAWENSSQSADDQEKLADWLLQSTVHSMPGWLKPLPSAPEFSSQTRASDVIAAPTSPRVAPTAAAKVPELTPVVPVPAKLASNSVAPPVNAETQLPPTATNDPPTIVEVIAVQPIEVKPTPTPAVPAVSINLTELTARIAGYHAGLADVESSLRELADDDLAGFGAQLDDLESLAHSYQFIQLYYDLLSEAEQKMVTKPRSLNSTLKIANRSLKRLQKQANDDFLDEFDTSHQQSFDQLGSRLEKIAAAE